MPRKRTATVEETTTRRVTLTDEEDTLTWAATAVPQRGPAERWNAQRRQQVWRAAEIIVAAAHDPGPYRPLDPVTLHQAVTILRALPGATPLELTLGRSA